MIEKYKFFRLWICLIYSFFFKFFTGKSDDCLREISNSLYWNMCPYVLIMGCMLNWKTNIGDWRSQWIQRCFNVHLAIKKCSTCVLKYRIWNQKKQEFLQSFWCHEIWSKRTLEIYMVRVFSKKCLSSLYLLKQLAVLLWSSFKKIRII